MPRITVDFHIYDTMTEMSSQLRSLKPSYILYRNKGCVTLGNFSLLESTNDICLFTEWTCIQNIMNLMGSGVMGHNATTLRIFACASYKTIILSFKNKCQTLDPTLIKTEVIKVKLETGQNYHPPPQPPTYPSLTFDQNSYLDKLQLDFNSNPNFNTNQPIGIIQHTFLEKLINI